MSSLIVTIAPESSLPQGQYTAKLFDISLVPANVEKGYKEGIKYAFEIIKGDHTGKRASRTTDRNLKPNVTAGKFLSMLMGKSLVAGQLDLQTLIGKTYLIQVMPSQGGGVRVETAAPFPM